MALSVDNKQLMDSRHAVYMREYNRQNAEKVSAYRRARNILKGDIIRRQRRESYLRTKTRVIEYQKKYRAANIWKIKARDKKWREENRATLSDKKREYYRANKEQHQKRQKQWHLDNPGWGKKYRDANRERIRVIHNKNQKRRRARDPSYRAAASMRSRVWSLLKKNEALKRGSTGLTRTSLKAHLEGLFKPGMNWENYGKGWHIDHIVPCSAFDLTNPEHLKFCFSLSNLQPMWAAENIRKHDTIPEGVVIPFKLKQA